MSMGFHVGQKVVRVRGPNDGEPLHPSASKDIGDATHIGEVYEVREIGMEKFVQSNGEVIELPGCKLYGVVRVLQHADGRQWHDCFFAQRGYRPLVEKPEGLEVFRQIAKDVSAGVVREFKGPEPRKQRKEPVT